VQFVTDEGRLRAERRARKVAVRLDRAADADSYQAAPSVVREFNGADVHAVAVEEDQRAVQERVVEAVEPLGGVDGRRLRPGGAEDGEADSGLVDAADELDARHQAWPAGGA